MSPSARRSGSTRSSLKASPSSTSGSRSIRRCGPTLSRPWNTTSTPGPPVKRLGGRNDDDRAPRKPPDGRYERWFDNASLGITARRTKRPDPDDGRSSLVKRHGYVRGRVRHHHIRAKHPAPDPRRVGSPHRVRPSRPLVHDASPPRCARRGEYRLQERPGPISRDRKDSRVATAEGLRTRVERRAPEGTPEGGEEHRTLGAHPRRRGHAPPPHAQAADTPDGDRLLVRHPRLPRPARERTRRRTPGGLAHPGR